MTTSSSYDELIDCLRGTALDLGALCDERSLSQDDDALTSAVDEAIFECCECGWWCDISEEVSAYVEDVAELLCNECARDNHDYNGDD